MLLFSVLILCLILKDKLIMLPADISGRLFENIIFILSQRNNEWYWITHILFGDESIVTWCSHRIAPINSLTH